MVAAAFPLIFLSPRLADIDLYIISLDYPTLYLFYFLLGMSLSRHYMKIKTMPRWVLVVVAAIWLSCVFLPVPFARKTLCIFSFNLLLLALMSNKSFGQSLFDKAVLLLDKCSFGMYVFHQMLIVSLASIPPVRHLYADNPAISISLMFITAALASLGITYGLKKFGFKWI